MKRYLIALGISVSVLVSAGPTVVLDPGHGGRYVGTSSPSKKIIEKEAALTVALQVAKQLKDLGYTVILTRVSDKILDEKDLINDLTLRAKMTTDHNAAIFVSIHFNGSLNPYSRGFEIYVPYEDKFPIKSYALAGALHYDLSHEIAPDFGGGTLGNLNGLDRGIKASRFNVLKKATCPAALVELAYITNPQTEQQILKDGFDVYVTAVTKGIIRYLAHAKKGS